MEIELVLPILEYFRHFSTSQPNGHVGVCKDQPEVLQIPFHFSTQLSRWSL